MIERVQYRSRKVDGGIIGQQMFKLGHVRGMGENKDGGGQFQDVWKKP